MKFASIIIAGGRAYAGSLSYLESLIWKPAEAYEARLRMKRQHPRYRGQGISAPFGLLRPVKAIHEKARPKR